MERKGLVFVFSMLLFACANGRQTQVVLKPGEEVKCGSPSMLAVPVGDAVDVNGINITFFSVEEESRCPGGGMIFCTWSGRAVIKAGVAELGKKEGVVQSIAPQFLQIPGSRKYAEAAQENSLQAGDWRIVFCALEPYPEGSSKPDPDDYVAYFGLIKAGSTPLPSSHLPPYRPRGKR